MANVWIGFYMIYRLHVIYSEKVLSSMFINVKCLLWCYSDCHFRLLSALPVKIFKQAMSFYRSLVYMRCYVAVCNNYAICNTLHIALNCNAVCNTSYFKLRCEGNAICNVLQIASKFYHLRILKRRKKNWSTAKCIASIISYSEFS